jgi:hypothetical protein
VSVVSCSGRSSKSRAGLGDDISTRGMHGSITALVANGRPDMVEDMRPSLSLELGI